MIGWAINIKAQIKVACVGNSITENIALSNKHKYPSILQDLLGNGYIVRNYGIGARTMLKKEIIHIGMKNDIKKCLHGILIL